MPQIGVMLTAHRGKLFVQLGQDGQSRVVKPATLDEYQQELKTVVKLQRYLIDEGNSVFRS